MTGTAPGAVVTRGVWQKLAMNFIAPNMFNF